METRTASWRDSDPGRRWALVLPREHGAWEILLVSSLTGISVGAAFASNLPREVWLLTAASALFCAYTPIENALLSDGPLRPRSIGELRWMCRFAAISSGIAGVALAVIFTDSLPAGFFAVGLIAAGTLEAQIALRIARRDLRVAAQLMGAFELTSLAAMTYSLATARMDRVALALWAVNGLFATNQIVYARLRIRQAKAANHKKTLVDERVFLASEFLTAICLTLAWQIGWIPGGVLLAFAPLLMHGAIRCLRPNNRLLNRRRLDKEELAHGMVFAALVVIAFRMTL